MKKLSRILALVLVICMMLSILPAAFAEGEASKTYKLLVSESNNLTKYGNIDVNVSTEEFLKTFQYGDIVTIEINGKTYEAPVCSDYTDVATGAKLVRASEGKKVVTVAINYGQLAVDAGVAVVSGTGFAYAEGIGEIDVKFTMKKAGGYLTQWQAHHLERTNKREDYKSLKDEEFANFRAVATKGIKAKTLYRSSSPVNPEIGRNTYADAAAKAAGVKTFVNLADSEETAKAYTGYDKSYYATQKIVFLNLPVAFTNEAFRKGLADGYRFIASNDGPYLIHCTEGKDRAGISVAILECLMGASYDEIIADYMTTYYNYYGVKKDDPKYQVIVDDNIVATLKQMFKVEDLSKAKLADEAKDYLQEIGMSIDEIVALKQKLGDNYPFADVKAADWFYDTVTKMYETGIIKGMTPTTFVPQGTVTRAEFATMLYRYDGEKEVKGELKFKDCEKNSWYTKAVIWGNENGIIEGTSATTFEPQAPITREQIVTMVYRYAKYAGLDVTGAADLSKFKDAANINKWAKDAAAWAVANGILRGDEKSRINPQDSATRAESAALIARIADVKAVSDVTVLYTNDVHTYINNSASEKVPHPLSYATVSAYKQQLAKEQDGNVLLVDAGDHIQGTAYGGMDNGESIMKLMKAAGYDLATLGNHEFDYGMERALTISNESKYGIPYVSCNFYHEKDGVKGEQVLDSYKIFSVGGRKIAFIGITTPESFTKSTPKYFQNEKGEYIYGIAGGKDGKDLYKAVQDAIDAASKEADVIVALGHLGVDPASAPWTSKEVIANTTGLDAFIDGHSHSTVENEIVKDKEGKEVTLTQTGCYLNTIGQMTIGKDGKITTKLVKGLEVSDENVKKIQDEWVKSVDDKLNEKIASSEINFTTVYENGNRAIRSTETNLGDFNADAYYWFTNEKNSLDVDMAIMNGGGIRANADAGDWTYKTCKTINTFGNVLCVIELTGQQIKDALEFGARFTTGSDVKEEIKENGGFLQVAGCTYDIDTSVANTVKTDEKNTWTAGPDAYRVSNIKIYNRTTGTYEDLDLKATYRVAGTNYTLYNCGDGFNMFQGGKHVLDGISEDYLAMAEYAKAFKDGKISSENSPLAALKGYKLNYENAMGAGRITIK